MSKSSLPVYSEIDTTNELFEQLSLSLDNKFIRQRHIASKPKLKRLLKIKSSLSINNITAVCSRCKKETLVVGHVGDESDQQHISEKEVEVRKDFIVKTCEKKVHFLGSEFGTIGEIKEKADEKNIELVEVANSKENDGKLKKLEAKDNASKPVPESESTAPAHFQSAFFARRPSIIGNNAFWLPSYTLSGEVEEENSERPVPATLQEPEEEEESRVTEPDCQVSACSQDSGFADPASSGLIEFLTNIFKQTSNKQFKILQVATMLDETLAALTGEYFFKCKSIMGMGTYEIIEAISLKDVQKIMVSDTGALLVLEVCHASSLIEFKEFVPGYSEKTESLISLMVYAIARIKNFLLDVIRLPLLSLPTCESMHNWFIRQNEEIMYTGIAAAVNVSQPEYEDLSDESVMMKISGTNQFHPVLLLLRSGYLTSKCNGGCASRGCKYSVTLELNKEKVAVMRREDKPWPNCVRLITECMDITFAGSRKASADELMEKLYCCIQPTNDQDSMKFQVFVLVTEHSLQLFKMTIDKAPLFGSPLLNLEIFDEETGGMACIIDSQGTEVDDVENLHIQNRWHLTFVDENQKLRFLSATSVELVE